MNMNVQSPEGMPMPAMGGQQSEPAHWAAPVKTGVTWPSVAGFVILALFVAGFGLWAASAPLAGASIAPGVVVASGQNLRVQHFEGGIIQEILVSEGEAVEEGQPLLRLDPTEPLGIRNRLLKALMALQARAERLQAERDGKQSLAFTPALIKDARAANLRSDLDEQLREFQKRHQRLVTDRNIIAQNIAAQQEKITGLEAQIKASRDQISILDDDIDGKQKLLKQGLTRKSEVNILMRNRAELEGRIGANQAAIAEAKTAIVEARQRQSKLDADHAEQAVTQLNEVRRQIADTRERILSAENVLGRVVVRSPAKGVIVTLSQNTEGGVVRQGEDILVILPVGGELIVEARVSPIDKDLVSVGQKAKMRFSSLNSRITPEVDGTVTFVSADRVVDPVSNEPYFPARLKIAEELPDAISREQIFPGMPVEVYVETGDRTFLEYLLKPATDSFRRAFREE